MNNDLSIDDRFGFIRPEIDAHTLGISNIGKLLEDCGYKVFNGDTKVSYAVAHISSLENASFLINWISVNKITALGFSYRLDPRDAQQFFGRVFHLLKQNNMFIDQGGVIKRIYFAGLPEACRIIQSEYDNKVPVFMGDETQLETLLKVGVPVNRIPSAVTKGSEYDDRRMSFAKGIIEKGDYVFEKPPVKPVYECFGTSKDNVTARIMQNRSVGYHIPLMRAHVGPYNSDYSEAKKQFKSWLKDLSEAGFLDIVSIGTSQLSQSDFGMEWGDKPNGGGVPVNSEQDYREIWDASRPLLVRTYAGTRNIPQLAEIYERTINIAWHALSFWWFNQIDGRGPYSVRQNLEQHFETLKVIAKTGKPLEPNIPHHFSFRGGDDYTYVLSAYLAAIAAKKAGLRYLVLQTMLNTPRYTWGVQDLAKARALLKLVRELEDSSFTVFLQPRAGLEYFSPDLNKAKIQLAAVTAMMDDIEPDTINSPDIIHVVSYCEAEMLATPKYINESIQITTYALKEYRKQRRNGLMDDLNYTEDITLRTMDLYNEVKKVVQLIEKNIANPYTPEGFYRIFKKGIMPVPYLWICREEFSEAVKWNTRLINGSVKVVDSQGKPVAPSQRTEQIFCSSCI